MQKVGKSKDIAFATLVYIFMLMGLWNCSGSEKPEQDMTEARLRDRIIAAYEHFHQGRFEAFIQMRSERQRSTMYESEKDKMQMIKEWKAFLEREKPTDELMSVQIDGGRGTAKMRVSVLSKDGHRTFGSLYDLWVFENGDWFLDDANRTSPGFFPQD